MVRFSRTPNAEITGTLMQMEACDIRHKRPLWNCIAAQGQKRRVAGPGERLGLAGAIRFGNETWSPVSAADPPHAIGGTHLSPWFSNYPK